MASQIPTRYVRWIGNALLPKLGRGAQLEFQSPTGMMVRAVVFGDGDLSITGTGTGDFVGLEIQSAGALSATGTGTASLVGSSLSDAPLSATGTGTALFVGEYSFNGVALHASFERGGKQSLGRGAQIEFQMPLPIVRATLPNDGALSATGTGTGTFVGASEAEAVVSATGTGTATFIAESTVDSVLSATGTATATFLSFANVDGALSATGTGTALFVGEYTFDGIALYRSFERGAKQALGRGPQVEFQTPLPLRAPIAQVTVDGVLSATGTGDATFVGASDTVAVTPPVTEAGGAGSFPGVWRKRKRRKKEALDELDELLVAVSQQVAPWTKAKAYEDEQALYRNVLERGRRLDESNTLARIEAEIANIRELLAEIDDEEAMLLLM